MGKLPNIPPKLYSFSAVAVGYALIDDLTSNEQNALGNWLMLVAQVLCTNAFYKQVIAERQAHPSMGAEDTLIMLTKMVNALEKEINTMKGNI